jgi:predicted enzyme related to lactoylglutathione lyase
MAQKNDPGVDPTLKRHGGLSYLEIPATDPARSATFYQNVLGWKVHGEEEDVFKFSDPGGYLIGRWLKDRAIARRPGMLAYFYVDQIAEVVKRVGSHGGEIIKEPFREGNLWICVVRDPAGNMLGLWEEAGA